MKKFFGVLLMLVGIIGFSYFINYGFGEKKSIVYQNWQTKFIVYKIGQNKTDPNFSLYSLRISDYNNIEGGLDFDFSDSTGKFKINDSLTLTK